jgi:predicted RNase H-like HicB family nuclease
MVTGYMICSGLEETTAGPTQGETLDELHQNLQEVIEMLLEDGEPVFSEAEQKPHHPSFTGV